jgi:hypothetical protein
VKIVYTGIIVTARISHPNGWEWSPQRIKTVVISNKNPKRRKKKKNPNQKRIKPQRAPVFIPIILGIAHKENRGKDIRNMLTKKQNSSVKEET